MQNGTCVRAFRFMCGFIAVIFDTSCRTGNRLMPQGGDAFGKTARLPRCLLNDLKRSCHDFRQLSKRCERCVWGSVVVVNIKCLISSKFVCYNLTEEGIFYHTFLLINSFYFISVCF